MKSHPSGVDIGHGPMNESIRGGRVVAFIIIGAAVVDKQFAVKATATQLKYDRFYSILLLAYLWSYKHFQLLNNLTI